MSQDSPRTGQPSATRGVAPPAPPRKLGDPALRRSRPSHPVVTVLVCILCTLLGAVGGAIATLSVGVLSGMRSPARWVFTESFRSPVLFVALCVAAIVGAAFWLRRLLPPRPPWAVCLALAFAATVVAVAVSALV